MLHKKLIAVIIAGTMALSMMTACGNSADAPKEGAAEPLETQTASAAEDSELVQEVLSRSFEYEAEDADAEVNGFENENVVAAPGLSGENTTDVSGFNETSVAGTNETEAVGTGNNGATTLVGNAVPSR